MKAVQRSGAGGEPSLVKRRNDKKELPTTTKRKKPGGQETGLSIGGETRGKSAPMSTGETEYCAFGLYVSGTLPRRWMFL